MFSPNIRRDYLLRMQRYEVTNLAHRAIMKSAKIKTKFQEVMTPEL